MQNDEQVFDFLAAAEDTGRQLDELIKLIPGEVRETLAAEYRKSPWLTELPKAADGVRDAAKQAEAATRLLARTVKIAGFVVCLASVIIPLVTWGVAHWNVSGLHRERIILERENDELAATIETKAKTALEELARREGEIKNLSATLEALRAGNGGGIELLDKGGGLWVLMLPPNTKLEKAWKEPDGRLVIPYVVSRK